MKPIIQRELDDLSRRIDSLRTDAASATDLVSRALTVASGSIDGHFNQLSGSIDGHFNQLSGTIDGHFNQLSGTIDGHFNQLSGTVDSAWKAGDSAVVSSLQAGVTSSVATLSGTVDAARVWNGLDPLRGTYFFDDFYTNNLSSVFASVGTAVWSSSQHGHPGVVRLNALSSGNLVEVIICDTGGSNRPVIPGGGAIEYEACMSLANLDNGTNNSLRRAGLSTMITVPADGVWIEVNRSRFGDNEFRFITAATGSRVERRTGVTVTDSKWFRLRVNISPNADAATGSLFCSGVLLSEIATMTYVPSSTANTLFPGVDIIKTLGASVTHVIDLDYHYLRQTFTGSRV